MSEEVLGEEIEVQEETTEEVAESPETGEEAPSEEVAEFSPDFSYKVRDEDHEFDEFLRSSVTSKEQEEALRDLYTKSAGLDSYKERLTARDGEYDSLLGQAKLYVQGFETLKDHRDKHEWKKLFTAMGVKDDDVLNAAKEIIDFQELPDEQREALLHRRELEEQNANLTHQLGQQQNQSRDMDMHQRANELATRLQAPGVAEINNAMAEMGRNMWEEVCAYGEYLTYQNEGKQAPSVEQCVSAIVQREKYLPDLIKQSKQQTEPISDLRQPTLPTIKSTNSAAVEKEYASVDDLRKRYDEMMADG